MNRSLIIIAIIGLVLVSVSCKTHEDEYHNITDKIEAKSQHYEGVSVTSADYFGNIETLEITEGDYTFHIPERKNQIKSYACSECHTKPLDQLQSSAHQKKAHWDIKLIHADGNTMNCTTCHEEDNIDQLTSLTGNRIDFNRSYQLCSQCHTKEFEDWKGGAHGKQLGGWAPPRASLTCVNCHNPHDPGFETKWPARFNTQKLKERQ